MVHQVLIFSFFIYRWTSNCIRVHAQGRIKSATAIPASCNDTTRLYVERRWTGKILTISRQPHDIWNLFAKSKDPNEKKPIYIVKHLTMGRYDLPWGVGQYKKLEGIKFSWLSNSFKYYNYPESKGGKGWLLGELEDQSTDSNGYTYTTEYPFGYCPGKGKSPDDHQMTLWRCNKNGTYPNFYAVPVQTQEFVFFDVDDKTYRLFVDTSRKLVRYEECAF